MSPFRGSNQAAGSRQPKGPVPQRKLLVLLRSLIDTSRSKAASRTRDEARAALRELMATTNWHTPYVLRNLGTKRCRYLSSLGYDIPVEDTMRSTIERLNQWTERKG